MISNLKSLIETGSAVLTDPYPAASTHAADAAHTTNAPIRSATISTVPFAATQSGFHEGRDPLDGGKER